VTDSSRQSFFFFGLLDVDEDLVVLCEALCIDSRGTTRCGVSGGVREGGVEHGVELGVMLLLLVLGERRLLGFELFDRELEAEPRLDDLTVFLASDSREISPELFKQSFDLPAF
jgi:hypothetical protein